MHLSSNGYYGNSYTVPFLKPDYDNNNNNNNNYYDSNNNNNDNYCINLNISNNHPNNLAAANTVNNVMQATEAQVDNPLAGKKRSYAFNDNVQFNGYNADSNDITGVDAIKRFRFSNAHNAANQHQPIDAMGCDLMQLAEETYAMETNSCLNSTNERSPNPLTECLHGNEVVMDERGPQIMNTTHLDSNVTPNQNCTRQQEQPYDQQPYRGHLPNANYDISRCRLSHLI